MVKFVLFVSDTSNFIFMLNPDKSVFAEVKFLIQSIITSSQGPNAWLLTEVAHIPIGLGRINKDWTGPSGPHKFYKPI